MKTRLSPRAGFFVLAILLTLLALGGCRAFEPEAVVVNQMPETYIIGSPMEHGGGYYHFHVFWYGSDRDGTVERFVWALTDTTLQDEDTVEDEEDENFNPALDASQLEIGHWTTKTDSIFDFTINQGVGTSYDMTLHMVAQDDFGDFDRTPARLHFFSNTLGNPQIQFFRIKEVLDGGSVRVDTAQVALGYVDTVGFNKRYEVFWKGSTPNIRGYDLTALAKIDTVYPYDDGLFGYKWRLGGELGGDCQPTLDDCWSPRLFDEASADSFSYFGDFTRLVFNNDGSGTSPFRRLLDPGTVNLQVNSIDVAGVEVADYLREFTFVVNYDPDTYILDNELDFAHPEDSQTYPYYVLLNDPLRIPHAFGSGDRVPDRSYVVFKALGRDNRLDVPLDSSFGMGFTGFAEGEIENYTGGRYSFRTSASDLDTEPEWGEGLDGWYADTLGVLVAPRSEMTVSLQAVDEFGRRDGSPASISFEVGNPPCVQCIEVLPKGGTSAFDASLACYDPSAGASHPCFGAPAEMFVRTTGDSLAGRHYLTQLPEAAFMAIDKVTDFVSFEVDTAGLGVSKHLVKCAVFGMDVLFHGQDHVDERYTEAGQSRWRTMAWKTQIDYDCDPDNVIQDGGGSDNIDVENWGESDGDGLKITTTGLWKKLVRVYVPEDLVNSGVATYRQRLYLNHVWDFISPYNPDDPRVDELFALTTRQFGEGRIQGVALDQTQCLTTPLRPGFYHTFQGMRPPAATPPGGSTWRACTMSGPGIVVDGSIPLPQMAMASNNNEPVMQYFKIVVQAGSGAGEDVECIGDGF